ncbi:hypothetical protein [Aeromicrobium sp. UC242_57]|uniref:hypothetical protein n=1 Tax=Aeromicrobium sp. UC242_57 TaxID=3374624 RepID=UPI0037952663
MTGRLRTETWATKEGEERESTVLEATLIAHDLTRGVTRFRKVERQQQVPTTGDGTAEALAELESQRAEVPAA